MAKAAHCALCGSNVYVDEDGGCPNGHSPEFLSNFYEVPDAGAPAAPEPTPVPEAPASSFTPPPVPPIPTAAPPSGTVGTGAPSVPAPPSNIPGGPIPMAPPKKKSKTGLIIAIVAIVLLCCIGSAAAVLIGGVSLFDQAADELSSSITITDGGNAGVPTTTADGTVRVELQWNKPVDLDLEIWTGDGNEAITSAGMENFDSFDGTDSGEYIDFKQLSDVNLSTGTYVVSVYFADSDGSIPECEVRLIVTASDGTVTERTGTVYWEVGNDQWHAFSINAETGNIVDINEYIEIETE